MKKLLAFDLDGTLAPSKSHFDSRMVELFNRMLENFQVLVISGGKYQLFQEQFLTQITSDPKLLKNLHLMPTTGTRYYRFEDEKWVQQYAEDLNREQKHRIIEALTLGWEKYGEKIEHIYGPTIEDRDSQVTLSPLGQEVVAVLGDAGVELKSSWDPDMQKRLKVANYVSTILTDFNVKVAGLTSIDVTIPGVDKAYGLRKLMAATSLNESDILFFGDKIMPGGNDYPVKEMGIDCIEVDEIRDTEFALEGILAVI